MGRVVPRAFGWSGLLVAGVLAVGWLTTATGVEPADGASREIRTASGAAEQESGQWVPLSPAPFLASATLTQSEDSFRTYHSGRVSSLAVDPRDPSRWLVGVGNGGVWETRDAGRSFAPIADDAPTLAIGAIAFAPSNPDIVYIGTGESQPFSAIAHVGVGLLKSTNGGQSWALLGQSSLSRGAVKNLRIHPNDPNTLLAVLTRSQAGRNAGDPPSPPPAGIVRSTDGGANWTRTLAGQATALQVDPRSFSRQYAAIAVGNDLNGIYRSTNGGVSWSPIRGPWWSDPSNISLSNGRIELAVAPSNPDVVYASVAERLSGPSSGNLLGLFRTDNAWDDTPRWIQIPTQATGAGGYCGENPSYAGRKCSMSHVISVDPRDANTLFAGGQRDLWRCTNCGASPTWTNTTSQRGTVFVHVDFHVLEWAGNRLITGNDGGVYSSIDLGASWQDHNRTLTTNKFYMGALHPTDPGVILGGLRDKSFGVYRPQTGWRQPTPVDPAAAMVGEGEVVMSSSRPNTDWAGANHSARLIKRTTDAGRSARQVDEGIDKAGAAQVVPLRKCPANDDVMLVATYRIWRSDNFFSAAMPSWTAQTPARSYPAQGFDDFNDPGVIHALTFVQADRDCRSYAYGSRGGEVRLTRNGGSTWTDLDPSRGLPARPINDLEFDPSNPDRLFAVVSSYDVATPTKPGHIFRTANAMSSSPTWTRVGPPDVPFADMPFNVILVDPRDTRIVYAGSDNGLWRSSDGGATFAKVGRESGLPPVSVYDIQINPTTNRTVIFTYGRGAFELSR